jgi:magnesium-transporting ATPase (P-type)
MAETLSERRPAGLSSEEAARVLARVGPNLIAEAKGPSHLRRFLANFVQLLALLLWVGAVLALVAGLPQLSAAIVVVIVVNAVFSYFQEHRAEQAVAALRKMLPLRVRVRRDGEAVEVPNEEIVPGDLLLLAPGDRVAADAELVTASDLRVDESTLTGESSPVAPDRQVLAGTYVTAGTAEALVAATGMETRFGLIAELAQQTRHERSPLERELDHLTRLVALLAVTLYREATTMTMAGIVMAQVGAGLSWRTNRLSLRAVGLWSNRLLLVGIAVEVAMIGLLAYTPGLDDVFHARGLGVWDWVFLLAWPPIVLGAEEARKAAVRRAERQSGERDD